MRHGSSFSPFRPALCLAPRAACSCFSTAVMWAFRSLSSPVSLAAIYVESSFNCPTMSSTSSILISMFCSLVSVSSCLISICSSLFSSSSTSVGGRVGAGIIWERVFRWFGWVGLSSRCSIAASLLASFATVSSRWAMLLWIVPFISSYSYLAFTSLFISSSFALFRAAHWFRMAICAAFSAVISSPSVPTLLSNIFPAYCTVIMEVSAVFFHSPSALF
jgi:hypothetical protein